MATSNYSSAILNQQKQLNQKYGAGLKEDGILGPLTNAALNKYGNPYQTSSSQSQNVGYINNPNNTQGQAQTAPEWNLSKWTADQQGNFIEKPTLTINGKAQQYGSADDYINALSGLKSQEGMTGPLDQFINEFRGVSKKPTIPNVIDSSTMGSAVKNTVPQYSAYNPAQTNLQAMVGVNANIPQKQTSQQNQQQSTGKQNTIQSTQGNTQNQGNYAEGKISGYMNQMDTSGNPYLQQLQQLTNQASNEGADKAQLQQQNQIAQQTQVVNEITARQYQDKMAYEQEKQRIQNSGLGISRGAMQQDLSKLEKDYMNKNVATEIDKSLKMGNLKMANDIIDQTLAATYEPIKKNIEYTKEFIKLHNDDLTESQKMVMQADLKRQEKTLDPQSITDKYGTGSIGEYNFAKSQGYKASFNQYQNEDANRKKSIARAGASSGLGYTPAQINSTVNSIAGSFDNEPIVKNFNIQSEGYQFANSIPSNTKNPSDHQGLVYAFAKAMDPGSVVREGEYATVQKYAQSWAKAYGKGFEQAALGTGFLSETAIDNIKKTIKSRYDVAEKQYKSLNSEYNSRINKAKAGQGNSLTNYGTAFSAPSSKASSGSSYKDYQKLIK